MRRVKIFQVSAFARELFTGNQAAVCPLDEWLPDTVMQGIAAENNLSETAFFVARADGDYDLRWFTPTVEVDLCGHAPLASGHVVLTVLSRGLERVTFHTRSGALHVSRKDEMLVLDLPASPPTEQQDAGIIAQLAQVLGGRPSVVLDAGLPLAVFDEESDVAELRPDFAAMLAGGMNWISVTAPSSDGDTDFVSRFFDPGSGIDEDPVTGSAHGWLVPYWADRLGKNSLKARQVSKRGGWLSCEYRGERVSVAGSVIDYLTGEITVP